MNESVTFVNLLWVQVTRAREQQLLRALRAVPGFQNVELTEWDLTQTWFRAGLPAQDHILEAAIEALLSVEGFSIEIQGAMHGPMLAVVFNAVAGATVRPRRLRRHVDRAASPRSVSSLVGPGRVEPVRGSPRPVLRAAPRSSVAAAGMRPRELPGDEPGPRARLLVPLAASPWVLHLTRRLRSLWGQAATAIPRPGEDEFVDAEAAGPLDWMRFARRATRWPAPIAGGRAANVLGVLARLFARRTERAAAGGLRGRATRVWDWTVAAMFRPEEDEFADPDPAGPMDWIGVVAGVARLPRRARAAQNGTASATTSERGGLAQVGRAGIAVGLRYVGVLLLAVSLAFGKALSAIFGESAAQSQPVADRDEASAEEDQPPKPSSATRAPDTR